MSKAARERAAKRVAHVGRHANLDEGVRNTITLIETNTGSRWGCMSSLKSHAFANAMLAWFSRHDLQQTRQWSYVAARLLREQYRIKTDKTGQGGSTLALLLPLLSNHPGLIEWFTKFDEPYNLARAEQQRTHDFFAYQAIVALRGDWNRLAERCERVLADPPRDRSEQKYLTDHRFYLALARGDVAGMRDALAELVTPKALRARANAESGYTEDLASSYAVIYAKIAWRHGCEVAIDSPYVPAEWLPNDPLPTYDDHYDFLKAPPPLPLARISLR